MAHSSYPLFNVDGWKIEAFQVTRYEARKDGDTAVLGADTIAGIMDLIKMREAKSDDTERHDS